MASTLSEEAKNPRRDILLATVRLVTGVLAGLEVYHPDHDEPERARLIATATRLGLVMTGGSDDHGSFRDSGLGREVTPPESYERILAMATGDTPVPAVPPALPAVPGESAAGAGAAASKRPPCAPLATRHR